MAHSKTPYIVEATKITLLCLIVTGLFKLLGASDQSLLVVFNMLVMSAAATYSIERKQHSHLLLGSIIIVVSIVAGGLLGFYTPILAKVISIVFATLAFYLPKTKAKNTIFVTGALMFLIFSAIPFDLKHGALYVLYGVITIVFFATFFWLMEHHKSNKTTVQDEPTTNNLAMGMVAFLALTTGYIVNIILTSTHQFSHLYWVVLTVLVVTQGSRQATINASIKRFIMNTIGAFIAVILFSYILPANFLVNFLILFIFLFFIFFFGFSYVGRILFIELFILGFTHLFGDYQNFVALDRVVLTLIGVAIVIVMTIVTQYIVKWLPRHTHRR